MKIALVVAVFTLFGGCLGRIENGPKDIEYYGYGIFRRLCNYVGKSDTLRLTKHLVDDSIDNPESNNNSDKGYLTDKGKALVNDIRKSNPGLSRGVYNRKATTYGITDLVSSARGRISTEPDATGLSNHDMYLLLRGLLAAADEPLKADTGEETAGGEGDGVITVDEFIAYLQTIDDLIAPRLTKIKFQLNPAEIRQLLARFIAAIADDTADGHTDANEFTRAVMGDGALPYTVSVVMFRFMDFAKDETNSKGGNKIDGVNADYHNHSLIHVDTISEWLQSGNCFEEGVNTAFFMPVAA